MRRVLQITELVRDCLQQRDANCSITPAPPESCSDDSAAALLQARAERSHQQSCPLYCTSGRALGPQVKSSTGPGRVAKARRSPAERATYLRCCICGGGAGLRSAVLRQRCACKDPRRRHCCALLLSPKYRV